MGGAEDRQARVAQELSYKVLDVINSYYNYGKETGLVLYRFVGKVRNGKIAAMSLSLLLVELGGLKIWYGKLGSR